jgi:MarR family transcriptional regulator, temperature-dependent positive regulator of motility
MKLDHKNPRDLLELGQRPGHLIWRAQQRAWRVFREVAGTNDITPVQASVLLVIANQPGIDQRRLAETIALDKATTGNVVARLLRRGLIMRMTPPSDRRVRALYVTPSGKRLNVKLGTITRRARACLLEGLSEDEARELVRLLRKVAGLSAADTT